MPAMMADWRPCAAYFYVLFLDSLELAWEYLRRNADYWQDWLTHGAPDPAAQARNWGLR